MKATFSEIKEVVANNDKKRFQMIPISGLSASSDSTPSASEKITVPDEVSSEDPSQYLIRASQGHSLPIASSAILTPIDPASPDTPTEVVHGTYEKLWPAILASGGLKPMQRTHVHFASGLPGLTAAAPVDDARAEEGGQDSMGSEDVTKGKEKETVVSGMRGSANLLVWVDLKRSATEGGLKWWRSANGVLLTEGGEKGLVGLEFIDRVVDRRTGKVVWEGGKEVGDDGIGGGKRVGKMNWKEQKAAKEVGGVERSGPGSGGEVR